MEQFWLILGVFWEHFELLGCSWGSRRAPRGPQERPRGPQERPRGLKYRFLNALIISKRLQELLERSESVQNRSGSSPGVHKEGFFGDFEVILGCFLGLFWGSNSDLEKNVKKRETCDFTWVFSWFLRVQGIRQLTQFE